MHLNPSFVRRFLVDTLIGAVLCGILATVAAFFGLETAHKVLIPLAFSAVLLGIAWRFGFAAGVLGSFVAAVIFAVFLFEPLGALQVTAGKAKASLMWMVLIGVPGSFYFAPTASELKRVAQQARQTRER